MSEQTTKRRSAMRIMGSLIGLVKPLLHIMLAAIILVNCPRNSRQA